MSMPNYIWEWVSENIWKAIIVPVIVTIMGIVSKQWLENRKNAKKKKIEFDYIEALSSIEDVINELREVVIELDDIDRALFFKGSNSGGEPKPGEPYYAQLIYPVTLEIDRDLILSKAYNRIPIDMRYYQILREVIINKVYEFITKDEPDSLLKKIYVNEGVTHSLIYFLEMNEKVLFYISFATSDGMISDKSRLHIEIQTIPKIQNILKKYTNGKK